jgi:hypothetical protein
VLNSIHAFVDLHDRQNVLSRSDLLCAKAFWREELDQLKVFYKLPLPGYPPPELDWQVGFLFWGEGSFQGVRQAVAR